MTGFAAGSARSGGFLAGQVASLLAVMEHATGAEQVRSRGVLQAFDPRVRLVGMLFAVAWAVSTRGLAPLAGLVAAAAVLAWASHVPLTLLVRGVWSNVALFAALLALPALFLVPGEPLFHLPLVGWTATHAGLESALRLVGRSTAAASFAALTVLATPWPQLLKALRALRVPAVAVFILGMTYRYVFLLLQWAVDMFVARRSRQMARPSGRARRHQAAATAGVLLTRSLQLAEEVHLAMRSRGYRGERQTLAPLRMAMRDWAALAAMLAAALALLQ